MAAGDVVNEVGGANTTVTFQPAVGVEVCITAFFRHATTSGLALYDGTNWCRDDHTMNSPAALNCKMMINNTNYLYIESAGAGKRVGYTGITIK